MRWLASSLVSHDASSLWKTGLQPAHESVPLHHLVHAEGGEGGVVQLGRVAGQFVALFSGMSLSFEELVMGGDGCGNRCGSTRSSAAATCASAPMPCRRYMLLQGAGLAELGHAEVDAAHAADGGEERQRVRVAVEDGDHRRRAVGGEELVEDRGVAEHRRRCRDRCERGRRGRAGRRW